MPASDDDVAHIPVDAKVMWQPKNISATKMDQFRVLVNRRYSLNLGKLNMSIMQLSL